MPFRPFDPKSETRIYRRRLPHWRQSGTTYFVTARLADSIPKTVAEEWRRQRDEWLLARGFSSAADVERADEAIRHDYHRHFTLRFHDLIDQCRGECHLGRSDCAGMLAERLAAGHGRDYFLDAWCLMPNHFHVLVEPVESHDLDRIVGSWKGGSAREINQLLGRNGRFWQNEAFDHVVRSGEQMEHFRRYIFENPKKAGLSSGFVTGQGVETFVGL